MKKLSNPTSPFLMMIIPVMLFIGLSLTLKTKNIKTDGDFTTTSVSNNIAYKAVKVGELSVMDFLLKK
ncbi:hypothetical protein I5M32_03335 [Pedobacter sp. SD-b]|uniref:Ankyrin repeat-containing protein n=1 Tax=Pedobacter segetis TaxID=2793069 RepID=A0ABS1BGR1_9SPHI|nr:hypothetical protein [Pedobacter segetis]MBK0381981.1 hypothetical protein [Pedobacter segetis]